jgi:hypothetical protein
MVCYARPASRLAAILIVAWLVFARPVSHFFDTAALMVTVTLATVGAAVAAALVFAAFMSTRRRRASAGGCVSCQFRCQHAMTERRRPWLVTTTDRGAPGPVLAGPGGPGRRGEVPVRSVSVLLPVPAVRSAGPAGPLAAPGCGPAAPRWPDRPAYRSGQAGRAPVRERAGSPA